MPEDAAESIVEDDSEARVIGHVTDSDADDGVVAIRGLTLA